MSTQILFDEMGMQGQCNKIDRLAGTVLLNSGLKWLHRHYFVKQWNEMAILTLFH